MDVTNTLLSPRLLRLAGEQADGQPIDLAAFWQEVAESGVPLVEKIPGDDGERLVTFLYRHGKDGQEVGLVSNLKGGMGDYQAMLRIPATDIWYITHQLPKDTRETYQFSTGGNNIVDPLNPRKFLFPLDEDSGIGGWESSVFELPDAPSQPWITPQTGVPAGTLVKHLFRSEILGNQYPVWIYTPPGYSPEGKPYGFLVMLDGWFYTSMMPTPTILDNLLAVGKLPPMVAIMIGCLYTGDVRKRDYGCYPPYIEFLTQELLPWARQEVNLTDDPTQAAIVGASRGGLMASYIGLHLPGTFGNVLTQSGSFGWKPEGEREQEWLARQYAASPKVPVRFYMEAGLFETDLMMVDGYAINLLASNRHLRDVLIAKGYPVHYREFSGGHNMVIYRGTLSDGLLALLGKDNGRGRYQEEPAKSKAKPDMRTIQSLSRAVHPSFAMLAGCQLGVFSAIKEDALYASEIALALGVETARLRPLLYALVSAGLLKVEHERFSNTEETAAYLVEGSPAYMGSVYNVWAMIWEAEMQTANSIRFAEAQSRHLFDFAKLPAEKLETIYRGSHTPSLATGRMFAERYDFSTCYTLLDVGGGSGGLAIALAQAVPHLTATVLELPNVAPITQKFIEEAGLKDRVRVEPLDAVMTPIPGLYDCVVLSKVLQTLSADDCRAIIKHVGQALNPGGMVIILGTVLDDSRLTPAEMATINLFFINVYDGGQAFTEGEHRAWLAEAGFNDFERVLLPDQLSIITAKKR